jgi:orotidine-5'-phosphate decarboxylase
VLTSLADEDLLEMGVDGGTEAAVLRLCELGFAAGLHAFVCSPREIVPIRQRFGPDITLVVPGIRPEWSAKGDQKRVFTPKAAIAAGADYLVIGRPVTQHPDPAAAWQMVMAEID